MIDLRLQRMAHVLVNYSLGLKKGERCAIEADAQAAPLLREVYRVALRTGALAEVFPSITGLKEILMKEGSDEQITSIPPIRRLFIEEYDCHLLFFSTDNTKSMSGVDSERIALAQKAQIELQRTGMQRSAEQTLRTCAAMFPTNAYAQDAEMSLSDFAEFVFHACFLNDEDPVARWRELAQEQERLVQWLKGKRTVHVVGKDTDLTLSIEGRTFISDDGHANFPGGEFYTGPVETSANGFIRYSFPASFGGYSIEDVRLRFENGVVVEAHAAHGQDYLDKMLSMDEGARRLGEFAFGNNPHVNRCVKNILFDEKMGGTIHLALGAGYPKTGSVNHSSLHWDMVCDLREGGEVRVDGELFSKDGKFVI
ncbi:aminopeptidase [Ktedonosporobacter rubrisoli]|uniref:Aminopeptidase n=1 Tax=Ktedonosporobacter rubrisoli TaxID=2509675 RepID=A0A4P6JJV5_KTERU|nr:aminopeptidase [Ktedonosporobacter rubrisoli]QBD75414.1 aminopeptidase [Ktedonosporobacter rubrisoli]